MVKMVRRWSTWVLDRSAWHWWLRVLEKPVLHVREMSWVVGFAGVASTES